MLISNIKIKGLFDQFDYDISLANEENLLIITGPNGFGKTMILNIIYSFFNRQFNFFQKLVFEEITMTLMQDDISVKIIKQKQHEIEFHFFEKALEIEAFIFGNPKRRSLVGNRKVLNDSNLNTLSINEWFNSANIQHLHGRSTTWDGAQLHKKVVEIFDKPKIHLIEELRLHNKFLEYDDKFQTNRTYINDTIIEYAKELSQIINITLQHSLQVAQELDSSFPNRLLKESGQLTKNDFEQRFGILKGKQERLKEHGLSNSVQEIPDFAPENAKVLSIYLNDSEKKLGAFDNLLAKLDLFTNILNERRFTFKSIKIDREKGFRFLTDKGKELSLTDLSSGEQHEVVLLYELIFNAQQNTLVLIDEPEISLHITWQKEFLSDLLKIIALQKMQVIVATHSPQIINDRWDLVYNLALQENQ